jgi:hypothetical protein
MEDGWRWMKSLFIAKSAVEVLAGLALAGVPSTAVFFLLGVPLDGAAATALGRIAGAALIALGIGCWLAHYDSQSRAARGLVVGTLFYDAGAVTVLLFARFAEGLSGIALWPGVALHSVLGIWCLVCLGKGVAPVQVTQT